MPVIRVLAEARVGDEHERQIEVTNAAGRRLHNPVGQRGA